MTEVHRTMGRRPVNVRERDADQEEQKLLGDQTLIRLGKNPVLRRKFGFLSMLGLCSSVMSTWEGIVLLLATNLTNGGLAGSVYGFIVTWIGTIAAFITMAELASMWVVLRPVSLGGNPGPKQSRVFLSYIIGWLTIIGWQSLLASSSYLSSHLIQGLVILNNPDATFQPWQTVLLYWALMGSWSLINTFLGRLLPKLENLAMVLHTCGFLPILVTLVYFAPHGSAVDVFTNFTNDGGWQNQGVSFFVGLVGPVFTLLGADSVVHMSEEIERPQTNIPYALIFSIMINGLLGFGMLVGMLFGIGDQLDTILSTPTGYPFIAILKQAVNNIAGTSTMTAIVMIMSFPAGFSTVATTSRLTWSFTRDRGLPGWTVLKRIEPRTTLPLWSVRLTALISILLSLIILGSPVAFNDFASVSVNALYASYLIGNSLLLWRRVTGQIRPYDSAEALTNTNDSESLSWGAWRVSEPWGTIVNAFGYIYMAVVFFFGFRPTADSPGPADMNYGCLIMGAVVLFSIAYYFMHARRIYTGPVIETMDTAGERHEIKVGTERSAVLQHLKV